jgi:DnaK suppressor protein
VPKKSAASRKKPARTSARSVRKPASRKPAKTSKPTRKPAKSTPKPAPKAVEKPVRKGITIVTPKPVKKAKETPKPMQISPSGLAPLLDAKHRKPLIPSGPKAAAGRALGQHGGPEEPAPPTLGKSPLTPEQLEHFRQLLLRKRASLEGDVREMEKEALRSDTGSLSNMPSHLAEQGSDASEQAVALDLAAADRKLIREIDDALDRIAKGTYGLCEITGKPIRLERLEEIPWTRYSVEAARELERHSMR